MTTWQRIAYRGKHYELPIFDPADAVVVVPNPERARDPESPDGRVVAGIHGVFDIAELLIHGTVPAPAAPPEPDGPAKR